MKLNELRVGNAYLSTKWRVPVICDLTDLYELYELADGAYDDPPIEEIFEPLPITNEELDAMCFEYDGITWYNGPIMVAPNVDGTYAVWFDTLTHGRLYVNPMYVHELQDIYKSLTGVELVYYIEEKDAIQPQEI